MKLDWAMPWALGFGIGVSISPIAEAIYNKDWIGAIPFTISVFLFILAIIGRFQDLNQRYKEEINKEQK